MPEISDYAPAYYSMTWEGPRGYPEDANAGRCYITGMLGMLRYHGEPDVLFSDGTSGDGFSFRWFNGGTGAFHELWEYTLPTAGDLLGRIADVELDALALMERAWPEVKALGSR